MAKRAQSEAAKRERVHEILRAAGELLVEENFADVSMRQIAEQAGIGKASLYHYFSTREEVFLDLLLLEVTDVQQKLLRRFQRLRKPTVDRICESITAEHLENPRMCALFSNLASVLERNVDVQTLRRFKLGLYELASELATNMSDAIPGLSHLSAMKFLQQSHVILIGLWPMAHYTPTLDEALNTKELQFFRVDFTRMSNAMLKPLLQDWVNNG